MIPTEKLRAIKHLVTHINCPDGMATAMIIRDVLPDVKVTFLQYDTLDHKMLNPEPGMLFCDFSPYTARTQEFIDAGTIVLDHHKTQKAVVAQFGELGVFADEKEEPGVCGASLAFREVWKPLAEAHNADESEPLAKQISMHEFETVSEFARLAGIRDTWQRQSPDWLAACGQAEAVLFWPKESLYVAPDKWAEKLAIGPVLYENRLRKARICLEKGFEFRTPKGRAVLVFEGLSPSDACELDEGQHDLIVGFGFATEELTLSKVIFSTRSHRKFDCGAFCQAHGGGGHAPAAGFSQVLAADDVQPHTMFKDIFLRYEEVEEDWLKIVKAEEERLEFEKEHPEAPKGPKFEPMGVYNKLLLDNPKPAGSYIVHLDKYERDNLVWLFDLIGYPAPTKPVEPFNRAHTGDWLGQIASKLECHKGVGEPLMPKEELQEEVAGWVEDQQADEDSDTVNVKMSVALAGKIGLFKFLKDAGYEVAGELDSALAPDDVE